MSNAVNHFDMISDVLSNLHYKHSIGTAHSIFMLNLSFVDYENLGIARSSR